MSSSNPLIRNNSETQYRALFDLMPGSVVLLDDRGFVLDANPYFCRHIGYTRDELLGTHVTLFSNELPQVIEQNIRRLLAGEMLEHEITNVQKDGSTRFYELRESAVTLPDGSKGILAVSNDVTDRKRAETAKLEMERRLLHLQKLESLGVLAGGIAHDFNNLLAAMLGNVELAMMDLPESAPTQKSLKVALAAGRRAAALTHQMLAYSGRGHFVISQVNMTKLVQELEELLKASISKSIRLELKLAPALPLIEADANQLQQAVVNLITNASEAIGDQPGEISITTSVRDCGPGDLADNRLTTKVLPGRYVILEVRDNGCGMDESVQEKLFDPFFTTKFVGRGLGMSSLMGMVQGHNGAVLVRSELGKGTTVCLLLPVAAITVSTEVPTSFLPRGVNSGTLPSLSGLVLLADDEEPLRVLIGSLLKRMGLRVLSAADGEQAVALFQQHAADITFVLLDLTMPKLDGVKTLAEIRRLRPKVKAVLTSGYNGVDLATRYGKEGFDAFLQKPCQIEALVKLAQQMCASTR